MTDYIKLVGSFPNWAKELRETKSSKLQRPQAVSLLPVSHGAISDFSWLAQRGASELLGCPPPLYMMSGLRRSIEGIHDYWHGKMYTLLSQPQGMAQCIQDELEFNISNIPILPDGNHTPLDDDTKYTNAVLRVLITNFNCYVYAVEMKDAMDRIQALDLEIRQSGGREVGREIEWIRQLAGLLVEESKLSLRLFWASGPGKELVKMSLDKPVHESANITKDIRFLLNKPLDQVEVENAFDAAFAGFCLNPDERGIKYGDSEFTQMLAMEQAASLEDENLYKKYSYAIQMATGEYGLALELQSELPPITSPSVEPHQPKTFLVRLNISQSASAQICTALPFVTAMCNRQYAIDNSIQLWETHKEIQGIFARDLKLPEDVIGKLFPCMSEPQDLARWIPENENGEPLDKGKGKSVEKGNRDKFVVNRKEYRIWKKMFEGDDEIVTTKEIRDLYRSIGFTVENLGGSYNRFAPPNNAGTPFIIRIPVYDTYHGEGPYPITLDPIGFNMKFTYGWDLDWFTVNQEEGEIDEDDDEDMEEEEDGCRKGKYIFDLTSRDLLIREPGSRSHCH
ncbi:uncharacterized protein IL334_005725 [Kwoniella shivajii]|uniref:Uncharacterized protein n=1 Tax=Kwoniella shivajii TaxID=564305 RepID=A0ABZ1D4C7_9TREE|nr:hypothetical protein IL334_005725 [Kwoniella shivajii]